MFIVGQKVVCIVAPKELVKNNIYTVGDINQCSCGEIGIDIAEFLGEMTGVRCSCGREFIGSRCCFKSYRFRPLDHKFADDLCKQLSKEIAYVEI